MTNLKFDDFYQDYLAENPERKILAQQMDSQLKASVVLHDLRLKEGYTQAQLARLAGKPQSTISRIENGSMNVTFDTLAEIVNAMGHRLEIKII